MKIKMWHERAKAAAPKSEPEFWPLSFKVGFMEDEIIELRAKVKKLEDGQLAGEKVRHALMHAQTASSLLEGRQGFM